MGKSVPRSPLIHRLSGPGRSQEAAALLVGLLVEFELELLVDADSEPFLDVLVDEALFDDSDPFWDEAPELEPERESVL